ncbi:MAG: FN3 associated domain-containing protein [Syntrophomonadaceae bacterium]|nr:FN3 associated domain-containing protein [Syntrophomonadaceae bacterium]
MIKKLVSRGEAAIFSITRPLKIKCVLIVALLVVSLSLSTGCQQQQESISIKNEKPVSESATLIITGSGVQHQTKFTLDELKSMEDALVSECYSAINNWPAKKFYVARGIRISYLLQKAGVKNTAQMIIVRAADGYNATFTRNQLAEKRFHFPNLLPGNENGAREVPAILAWEYQQGTSDLSKIRSDRLCLFLGQKSLNDAVSPAYVKDVTSIEVLTSSPGQWDVVQAEPAPGKVKPGTGIVLNHPEQDQVKIYYTIDGTTPNEKSLVYNPSTSYYQPDLIKPVMVDQAMIIKAIATGLGKYNSEVSTFLYEIDNS